MLSLNKRFYRGVKGRIPYPVCLKGLFLYPTYITFTITPLVNSVKMIEVFTCKQNSGVMIIGFIIFSFTD